MAKKTLPTIGSAQWGDPLNNFINQFAGKTTSNSGVLSDSAGGGLNYGPADPVTTTWNADNEGFTFINTTDKEIKRWVVETGFANGHWVTILKTKDIVTGNRIYYVNNTTGNDTNDGLSSTTAFATLEKASQVLSNNIENKSGFITIQIANSTTPYAGTTIANIDNVTILGNISDPTQVVINANLFNSTEGKHGFLIANCKGIIVKGVKFINTGSTAGLIRATAMELYQSTIFISDIEFNSISGTAAATNSFHLYVNGFSELTITGNYKIVAGASMGSHIGCANNSVVGTDYKAGTITATISGTQAFQSFVNLYLYSMWRTLKTINWTGGTIVGMRAQLGYYCLSLTGTALADGYFPGNSAGIKDGSSTWA